MIHVIASVQLRAGRRPDFIKIFKANVPHVLAEKGCIEYAPAIDSPTNFPPQETDDNRVTVIEKWERLEDLSAHMTAPHMLAYKDRVKDMVEGVTLRVLEEA